MRKIARTVGLSLTAAALCFGAVACSADAPNNGGSGQSNTQEQLTKRTASEAKKTLDGFFAKISAETGNLAKTTTPVSPNLGSTGKQDDIMAANLTRIKAGFPASYAYLDETSLGSGGVVKLIAFYAHISAAEPGTVFQSTESGFKLEGNTANISGSDIKATTRDGKPSSSEAGYISMTFINGEWKISDFSQSQTPTAL